MPSILIEVRKQYSPEQETALIDAVLDALREAFKILPGDKNVRLMIHEPHRFACPPARAHPELYTHISIDCFAGRSPGCQTQFIPSHYSKSRNIGIPKDHVKILLREIIKENWEIRGGFAACDEI